MKTIWRFSLFSALVSFYSVSLAGMANQPFLDAPAVAAYSHHSKKKAKKNGQYEGVDSWTPYFTNVCNVQNDENRTFALSTVGVGFIYFSKVKGDLSLTPAPARSVTANTVTKKVGGFSYNRTPVYDLIVGYRVLDWLQIGGAIQAQNNISFQSRFAPSFVPNNVRRQSTATLPKTQFRANIDLNSVYLKAMFEIPWVMILKSWMYALYGNVGVGAAWQSWTDVRQYVQYTNTTTQLQATFVNTLNQKYGANVFWQIDAGIRAKSAALNATVSFVIGCKFNSWGKIPNIGSLNQQGSWNFGFKKPYSARLLYSFAPYIGLQWNF